jgi:glutamate N-acetyltransferase/amino-acid N-acetyltransferase
MRGVASTQAAVEVRFSIARRRGIRYKAGHTDVHQESESAMMDHFSVDAQPAALSDVAGFRTGIATAGIKKSGKPDVGILLCEDEACAGTAVFTRNEVAAAPVKLSRGRASAGRLRACVVNAGNANCCTGVQGAADAKEMSALAAELLDIEAERMLVASTGVIGRLLPMDKVRTGVREACAEALGAGTGNLSSAILTTDTRPKASSASGTIGGKAFRVAGICKGAGMIAPNMATMLAFLVTDAAVAPDCIRDILRDVTTRTFNRVTVDNDTSTNDTLCMLASGRTGNARIESAASAEGAVLAQAVEAVSRELAIAIAADGEGATRVIEITVTGAASDADAEKAGRAIAESYLVKTAAHGADPNWGRILAAAGRSGAKVDEEGTVVKLAGTAIFIKGTPVDPAPAELHAKLKEPRVAIEIDLGLGSGEATFWTCDLSREYITINADYHT